MNKIKDEIARSLEPIGDNIGRSIVWEHFLFNYFAILIQLISGALEQNLAVAKVGDEKVGGGEAVENNPLPFIEVLIGNDFVRHNMTFLNMRTFFDWYLEQNAEADFNVDTLEMWYDYEPIRKAYVKFCQEVEQ